MGYYIRNTCPMPSEAIQIHKTSWENLPCPSEDYFPVVEVDNFMFVARGICYAKREYEDFTSPSDHRPKKIYLVPKEIIFKYLENCTDKQYLEKCLDSAGKGLKKNEAQG
jgi:hypothetical protein